MSSDCERLESSGDGDDAYSMGADEGVGDEDTSSSGRGARRNGKKSNRSRGGAVRAVAGATTVTAIAVAGIKAASIAVAAASTRRSTRPTGRSRDTAPASEEKAAEVARLIGEVADKVLKHVSDRMPGLEAWTIRTLDTIFAPRLVLRHLMVAVALQTGLLTWNGLVAVANKLLARMSTRHGEVKTFRQKMRTAKDYEEWRMYAEKVDHIEGHDEWRKRPDSLLYNHKVLQQQINDLNAMINAEDVFGLMFRLRGSLSRNQHGMLHEGLFSRAHAGTKVLVERYHEVVCESLHYVCAKNAVAQDIPTDAKLAFFNETRHAYGRTALMLSGGAAMGVYHAGVVKALLERRLLPRVVSGASAGSIVAAMVGTRTDAELKPMFEGKGVNLAFFQSLRRSTSATTGGDKYKNQAFWQLLVPPGLRWMGTRLWNVLLYSEGFLSMDTDYFRKVLRNNIGPATFQEAFDRTGRIVNITVAPQNRTDPPRLLNYLTAPHVVVWSAAVCSSSVPGVFEPSILLVKDADGSTHPESGSIEKFVDGSMEADLPMQQISELFNINHFIVSQVNPHASLLSTMALSKSVWSPPIYSFLVGLVGFLQTQVRNWFRNVIEFVSHRRMAPVWASKRGGIQLLTQEYEGRHCDVTITPWKGEENILSSFAKMLKNVSTPEFIIMAGVAERNTWPKVEMIRSHCAVEMCLEQCVQALRHQLTAENQVRMLASASSEGLKRRGRVPSFYTSRSLVNLSGLSVTDPSIVMEQPVPSAGEVSLALGASALPDRIYSFGSRPSLCSESGAGGGGGVGGGGSGGEGGAIFEEEGEGDGECADEDVGLSIMEEASSTPRGDYDTQLPNGSFNVDSNTSDDVDYGGNGNDGSGRDTEAYWGREGGDSLEAQEVAWEASGGASASAAVEETSVGVEREEGMRVNHATLSHDVADLGWVSAEQLTAMGLARQEDVVKSTSMANFYYRRSKSVEASMSEMRKNAASSGNLSTRSDPSFAMGREVENGGR